jgi:hypothetical protein
MANASAASSTFAAQFLAATDDWEPTNPDHPATEAIAAVFIDRLHSALSKQCDGNSTHIHDGGTCNVHIGISPEETEWLQAQDNAAETITTQLGFAPDAPVAVRLHLHGVPPKCKSADGPDLCLCCPPPDPRGACAQFAIWRSHSKTRKTVVAEPASVVTTSTVCHHADDTADDEPVEDLPDQYTSLGDTLALVLETGRAVRVCKADSPADWYFARAYQHQYGGTRTEREIRDAIQNDAGLAKFLRRLLEHPVWKDSKRWGVVVEDCVDELRRLCDCCPDDSDDLPDGPDRCSDALIMLLHRGVEKPDFPSDPYFARGYQRCFGGLSEKDIHEAIATDHAFARFVRRMLEKLDPQPKPPGTGGVIDDCISGLYLLVNKTLKKDGAREMEQPWREYLKAIGLSEDGFWELFNGWTTLEQYTDRVMKQHIQEHNGGDIADFVCDMYARSGAARQFYDDYNYNGLTLTLIEKWTADNHPETVEVSVPELTEPLLPTPADAETEPLLPTPADAETEPLLPTPAHPDTWVPWPRASHSGYR